eukprot:m.331052 g.331052  ORF g.331052 m.331052 type:complete len:445 (+) comp20468_c0_seq11:286-1620(+)
MANIPKELIEPPYPEWYHCGKTKSEITKLVEGSPPGDYAVYPKKDGSRLFFTLNDFGKAVRYAIDIEDGHSCSFNGAKYTNVVTCVNKIVRVSQVESIQSVTRPGSTIVVGNPARAKQVLNANQEKLKSALFDSDDESSEDIIAAATAAERKKRADRKKMLKLQEETAAREKELERLKRENDAKRKKEAAEKKKQEVETAAKRAAEAKAAPKSTSTVSRATPTKDASNARPTKAGLFDDEVDDTTESKEPKDPQTRASGVVRNGVLSDASDTGNVDVAAVPKEQSRSPRTQDSDTGKPTKGLFDLGSDEEDDDDDGLDDLELRQMLHPSNSRDALRAKQLLEDDNVADDSARPQPARADDELDGLLDNLDLDDVTDVNEKLQRAESAAVAAGASKVASRRARKTRTSGSLFGDDDGGKGPDHGAPIDVSDLGSLEEYLRANEGQ